MPLNYFHVTIKYQMRSHFQERRNSFFAYVGRKRVKVGAQKQHGAANQRCVPCPAVMQQPAKWPGAPDEHVTGWRKGGGQSCQSHTRAPAVTTRYRTYHHERVLRCAARMLIICLVKQVIIGAVKLSPLCLMTWLELRKLTLLEWLLPISGDSLTEG